MSVVTIRDVERYWDSRPCNVRHGTAPVGTLEWSRQVTERKYKVEPHIPEFAQFERWRRKRVLEIGCGIGTDTLSFRRHGAYVDAMELSSESMWIAKKRIDIEFPYKDNSSSYWFPYNAEEWTPGSRLHGERPLAEGPYDLVYSFGVLHHTVCPEKVLSNIRYSLKDNGELRVMLYAKWSIKHLFGEQPEAQAGCPIVRWYSKRAARELLRRSGFKVESITKAHIFPWRVADYVQHRYVKRAVYLWMPSWLFSWLERRLGHHLLIVARKA